MFSQGQTPVAGHSFIEKRPEMLDREEYVEQAYLFRNLADRISNGIAAQEALRSIGDEGREKGNREMETNII